MTLPETQLYKGDAAKPEPIKRPGPPAEIDFKAKYTMSLYQAPAESVMATMRRMMGHHMPDLSYLYARSFTLNTRVIVVDGEENQQEKPKDEDAAKPGDGKFKALEEMFDERLEAYKNRPLTMNRKVTEKDIPKWEKGLDNHHGKAQDGTLNPFASFQMPDFGRMLRGEAPVDAYTGMLYRSCPSALSPMRDPRSEVPMDQMYSYTYHFESQSKAGEKEGKAVKFALDATFHLACYDMAIDWISGDFEGQAYDGIPYLLSISLTPLHVYADNGTAKVDSMNVKDDIQAFRNGPNKFDASLLADTSERIFFVQYPKGRIEIFGIDVVELGTGFFGSSDSTTNVNPFAGLGPASTMDTGDAMNAARRKREMIYPYLAHLNNKLRINNHDTFELLVGVLRNFETTSVESVMERDAILAQIMAQREAARRAAELAKAKEQQPPEWKHVPDDEKWLWTQKIGSDEDVFGRISLGANAQRGKPGEPNKMGFFVNGIVNLWNFRLRVYEGQLSCSPNTDTLQRSKAPKCGFEHTVLGFSPKSKGMDDPMPLLKYDNDPLVGNTVDQFACGPYTQEHNFAFNIFTTSQEGDSTLERLRSKGNYNTEGHRVFIEVQVPFVVMGFPLEAGFEVAGELSLDAFYQGCDAELEVAGHKEKSNKQTVQMAGKFTLFAGAYLAIGKTLHLGVKKIPILVGVKANVEVIRTTVPVAASIGIPAADSASGATVSIGSNVVIASGEGNVKLFYEAASFHGHINVLEWEPLASYQYPACKMLNLSPFGICPKTDAACNFCPTAIAKRRRQGLLGDAEAPAKEETEALAREEEQGGGGDVDERRENDDAHANGGGDAE